MTQTFDVAVIGAGIVGLAHAWAAVRSGLNVVLFDRSGRAQGATVRNFGMIWPIGQPAGQMYEAAMRSRELWLELTEQDVVRTDSCGSVHLAHHDDEMAVLEEFASGQTHDCRLLSREEVADRVPVVNPDRLRGGLWSPTELRANPRQAADQIAAWLRDVHNVPLHFSTSIVSVDDGVLTSADGQKWKADQTVICSGSDLQTLFPDVLSQSGLKLCKLQMLRTTAQTSVRQEAHIASGLTLRHYTSFSHCPSLKQLQQRIATESPVLDQYGIHVMATQADNGQFILGDSHEYDDDISPFDKAEIDNLILSELQKILRLPDWTVTERWHGIYSKHPDLPVFQAEAASGVHVFVGTGGAGMTMSFALAEQFRRA